jgi:hypothetical protein
MFPVPGHSAEKVQNDINTILHTIAQFLSKIKLDHVPQPVLAPVELNAVLEEEPLFEVIDVEVFPEYPALPGHDPDLLEGHDPNVIAGRPSPPTIAAKAEIQLQIEDTYIIALLPDLRPQLEQLPTEQVTALTQAIASSTPVAEDVIDAEIIDIRVNGIQCFHQEQGQVSVNRLLPASVPKAGWFHL